MRRYSPVYFLSKSFKGFFRNGFMSLASIIVLSACLILIGCFGLLLYNLNLNMDQLGRLNEIVVQCNKDLSKEEVAAIGDAIRALPNVTEDGVTFVSKEEAFETEKEKYSSYSHLTEAFDRMQNPLPDVYHVIYANNEDVSTLTYNLRSIEGVDKVTDRVDIANKIESVSNTISMVFFWFLVILVAVSVIIIMNTVKLSVDSRNEEIIVSRYLGATNFFITFPFMIESIFIGIISVAVSYGVVWYAYGRIYQTVAFSGNTITVAPFVSVWYVLLIAFAVIAFLTCYIGSKISLVKHIKA